MNRSFMLTILACLVGIASAPLPAAAEIPGNRITIGVLTDLSGSNSILSGQGSIEGARLAIAEAAAFLPGVSIELISADMPPKADAASAIARTWLATGNVNVIADVPFSSAGLAINEVVRNAPRTIYLASGTGTSDLTGPACSPNTVHWTYDTYALSQVVARAGRARAEVVVLHNRRLRLRHSAGARCQQNDHRVWRHGAREYQKSALQFRLFVVFADGPNLQGAGASGANLTLGALGGRLR